MESGVIRAQVERILRSKSFASKSQLRKLLEVLSKNIDSQSVLSPDLVIRELWPDEVRTKRSSDVATEINRLRHVLEAYYNVEGNADPITISLPNRSVSVGNGKQERRWIVAEPRNDKEDSPAEKQAPGLQAVAPQSAAPTAPQVNRRRGLKTIAAVTGLCATLGLTVYFFLRGLTARSQPAFGRLDGSVLRIMDAQGKELWSKNFPQGFRPDWNNKGEQLEPPVWFEDLEGQGHVNVLFALWPAGGQPLSSSTLICYSDRGKEKWRWTPGKNLPELNGNPAVFITAALAVLKATPNRPARIVVASVDPWWPSQIAILDSNGKILSEYWHSGPLTYMTLADLYADSREMIVAAGVANGYDHEATLVVLDPDRLSGTSTEERPEFQIHGMGVGEEELRLLFPRSDFNRAALFTYNEAIEPLVQDGKLRLAVQECPAPKGCPVWYEFDKNTRLIAAYAGGDEFRNAHNRFYQNGEGAHTLSAEEQAAFVKVRCLVGCKSEFVPLAQNYDPTTSFEKGWTGHDNPNGVWSYGYSAGFTSPVTFYDKTAQNGVNGPNAQYWLSLASHIDVSPAVEYNRGPAYDDGNVGFLANELLLVAGTGGQYSDLIFTAPARSEYSAVGNFRGAQYGVGTSVGIVANGTVVFSSGVTSFGQIVPFNLTLNLAAGSKLVFSAGPGKGFQNTGISATITRPCGSIDKPASTPTGEIICSEPPNGLMKQGRRDSSN